MLHILKNLDFCGIIHFSQRFKRAIAKFDLPNQEPSPPLLMYAQAHYWLKLPESLNVIFQVIHVAIESVVQQNICRFLCLL